MSRPDPERSTCGNRRVPLSGSHYPRLPSRTRKAYDISTQQQNSLLPTTRIYIYIKILISTENSTEPRLKDK